MAASTCQLVNCLTAGHTRGQLLHNALDSCCKPGSVRARMSIRITARPSSARAGISRTLTQGFVCNVKTSGGLMSRVQRHCRTVRSRPASVPAASAQETAAGEGPSTGEKFVDVNEFLKSAYDADKDLVFAVDDDEDVSDPFAPRQTSGSKSPDASPRVFPSSSDITKVLSAYQEASPSFREMSVRELREALQSPSPPMVVDVRSAEEYAQGHVPEAILAPLPDVVSLVANGSLKLEGRQVALICRSGMRSAQAASKLKAAISDLPELINVTGGTLAWMAEDFPVKLEA